jgi:hypothetical protein
MYARAIRGDFTFGEQILDIADNTSDDWSYNPNGGKLSVNKEAMLRSKIQIGARQFHMSRLHSQPAAMGRQATDPRKERLVLADRGRAPP